MTTEDCKKFWLRWRKGLLDGKLLAEVTAMRPDLKAADLICQSLQSCGPDLPLDLDIDEEEDERVRLLTSLARSLKKEQDAMRAHRVAHQRYTAQTIASEREWQKGVAAAIHDRWSEHKIYFQSFAAKNIAGAEACEQTGHKLLAGRLLKEKDQAGLPLRFGVSSVKGCTRAICNFPMKCFFINAHLRWQLVRTSCYFEI